VEDMNWINLAQDRHQCWARVNTVMSPRVPWKAGNFLTGWAIVGLKKNSAQLSK